MVLVELKVGWLLTAGVLCMQVRLTVTLLEIWHLSAEVKYMSLLVLTSGSQTFRLRTLHLKTAL